MKLYVIYDHPADYPNGFVVRLWTVDFRNDGQAIADKSCVQADTLEAARKFVPQGFYNMGRIHGDDPKIAEVWI